MWTAHTTKVRQLECDESGEAFSDKFDKLVKKPYGEGDGQAT